MKIAPTVLAAGLAFLSALTASALGTSTPTARPTPPARPAPKVKLTQQEAEDLVKEMSIVVERIRGLKFKTPVSMKIIDGQEAREQFKSKVEPREEEQMKYTQEVYARLGLVPKGTDLMKDYLHLAEEGVDGYYEPGSKTFYLLDHVALTGVRAVMVHELTHALEDQHYDLKAVSKLAGGDDDRSTAIASLIEGSAMVVTLAYMSKSMAKGKGVIHDVQDSESKQRAEKLRRAPSFTQRSLIMPYVLGFSFLLRGHLWNWLSEGVLASDLDYAYKHPPLSTHHIIHPELYWQRPDIKYTPPKLPDLSNLLGEGWKKATEGSLGELGLSVLTGTAVDFADPKIILPETWSNQAAASTAGDVYQHYVNGDKRVTVLVTGWQDVYRARAFQKMLKVGPDRTDFILGASHLVFLGDVGGPDKALALAQAAFEGYRYWPHDEGVSHWPPVRGPELGLD
jgi:hypothetical protein